MDEKIKAYGIALILFSIGITVLISIIEQYLGWIVLVGSIVCGVFILYRVSKALKASRGWGGGFRP